MVRKSLFFQLIEGNLKKRFIRIKVKCEESAFFKCRRLKCVLVDKYLYRIGTMNKHYFPSPIDQIANIVSSVH